MSKAKVILVVVSLAMAGCDNGGVGVSAGTEQAAENRTSQSIQRTKELTQSKQTAITVEKSLFPYIVSAADEITGGRNGVVVTNAVINFLWPFATGSSTAEETQKHFSPDNWQGANESQMALINQAALIETDEQARGMIAALMIGVATSPTNGWISGFDQEGAVAEMRLYTRYSLAASEVMGVVASQLSSVPAMQPQELTAKAKELIYQHGHLAIESTIREEDNGRGFTRDLSGKHSAPIHFTTSDGLDVAVSGGGIQITRYGQPWFGAGYVEGKNYVTRVVVSRGANMKKGSTNETGTGTSEHQNGGASVNAG